MTYPVAALGCGLAGLASGVTVPYLVRRLPPVPVESDSDAESDSERRYETVDVAAVGDRPGLPWRSAVLGAGAGAAVGLVLGPSWPLLYLLPMVPVSLALVTVDWHTRILPSRLIYPAYPLVGLGIVVSWLLAGRPDGLATLGRAAIGAAVVLGLFYLAWVVHPRGMGFGDVRLSGLLGLTLASLGWGQLVVGIYAGFLLGGVIGTALSLARVVERRGYPFGPFLLSGALVGVVAGRPVLALFTS